MFFEFGMPELFIIITAIVFTAFGYRVGRSAGVTQGADGMITILEDNGFLKVKSRRTDEDGNQVTEYAKIDE